MINGYFDAGLYSLSTAQFEELKRKGNDPEAVEKVAKELEALFLYEMLKEMRKTAELREKEESGLSNYNTIIDMELSRVLAERGIGLRKYILDSINRDKIYKSYGDKVVGEREKSKNFDGNFVKEILANISSGFGLRRHPIFGRIQFHKGIDIALPEGREIRPLLPGKVIYSGYDSQYGYNIIVEHENGYATRYAHNQVNLVREGDWVDRDTIIAKVGKTGITTGPHLHLEVLRDNTLVDPGTFLAQLSLKF